MSSLKKKIFLVTGFRFTGIKILLVGFIIALVIPVYIFATDDNTEDIPIGKDYQGPKAVIGMGRFTVEVLGAPGEIGAGLRAMLMTALFESNYFIVVDRSDMDGITAEVLLSDSFLSDPDAILAQSRMDPAEITIYGAVIAIQTSGGGLYFKLPMVPLKMGGTYAADTVTIEVRVVDSASGRLIASESIEGTAHRGRGELGLGQPELPVELHAFARTPLELAIRDCIYRAVINLCGSIPRKYFRHFD